MAITINAKPGGTSGNVSVNLDQWADGPVSQGDADGTGQTQEVFVNGNLNAQKAHYNEGDAIPYRAIMDDLTPGVTYGLVIEWDTVDSGAYALDYLTGYNFSFVDPKHPGEPNVNPLQGVNGVSGGGAETLAAIQADPILMAGFGAQFGTTDGIDTGAGLPSGAQSVSIFGAVSGASVSTVTYNADKTKASVTITFTYTGTAADNADTVVVAWGGHIASSLDWSDDPNETVETASDISGSPYHMRVKSLFTGTVETSIGNQDRSLSADAVLPPIPPDAGGVSVVGDDDNTTGGIGDTATGDDEASVSAFTPLPVTDATSVDFASLHTDAVLDTSTVPVAVKSGGVALFYFWDGANSILYASTDVTNATTAAATAVFSIALQESGGVFDYQFTLLGQVDHPAGNNENDVFVDVTYTATGLGGTDTGTISIKLDDDLPVRATAPTPVTATVEEDGMSAAVAPEAGGLNGNDQSQGNPGAGDSLADDQASGAVGSLAALVNVGADDPGVFSLSNLTGSLPTLFSKGDAVTYAVTDSADADTLLDTLTATAGGRTVFTLKVNPDGSWVIDLDDQLDHVDDVGNAENTLLRTNLAGTTSVASIDFSSIVQVTDFDGDTVAPLLAGDFAVTVEDDIPVRAANPTPITPTVEEDGMSITGGDAGGLAAGDQSEGNRAIAGDSLTQDQASGAIGSLAALVSVGADEPPTFSLSNVTGSLPTLFSKGDAVTYAVTDSADADTLLDTVTATAGGRTIFTMQVNADGSWAFDLDDQLDHVDDVGNAENTVLRTNLAGTTSAASIDFSSIVQVTDYDGDTAAPLLAGDFAVTVEDDIPVRAANPTAVTATVEEDGMSAAVAPEAGGLNGNDQSQGNPGAGDSLADDQASGAVGSLTALMSVGADEPPTISLSSVTTSLPTLFSRGDAVTYAVTDSADADSLLDTLTATAGTRTVFTLQVNPNGSWAFDLDDQLDHVDDDLNTENTALRTNLAGTTSVASIDFSAIVQVTDFDGDTVAPLLAGDFAVTVQDDLPVINSISNIVGFNTGAPLTGVYDFKLGADEPTNTAVDGVILQSVTGTTSGGRAIVASNPAPTVTWQTETDTSVTFAFSFDYFIAQAPSTVTNTATGTVTFNKLDGTYVFDLASPINGSTTFSTSDVAGLITYNTGGNNSPEITVKEFTADFVGVLYARTTDGGSGAADDMNAGGDHTFTAGEVFNSVQDAYINVSTSTLGADSDTLQPEEVLNFDFFADNPVVPVSPSGTQNNPVSTPDAAINTSTPRAYADTVSITLNQININGQDDVAILLKLQKPGTNDTTTRLLLANSASDYVAVGANHVVTIGTDDYDFAGGYRVYGVQVLASTGNVTGGTNEAFELSDGPDAGTTQHDAVSLTAGGGTYADSSDNDVLKIVKIDVTVSLPADADLQFTGTLIDADGDSAGNFNFAVHLEGDSNVLAGGAGSDYLNGTAAANTMSGGAGADFMAGGAGADEFQFASGASGITLATADTIVDFATGVDKIATSKAAGNATIADGGGLGDFTAFVAAADAVLNGGAGVDDIYVAYNAAASGNAWAVVDENDSGAVDAGDTLVVLTGINAGGEIAAADFI